MSAEMEPGEGPKTDGSHFHPPEWIQSDSCQRCIKAGELANCSLGLWRAGIHRAVLGLNARRRTPKSCLSNRRPFLREHRLNHEETEEPKRFLLYPCWCLDCCCCVFTLLAKKVREKNPSHKAAGTVTMGQHQCYKIEAHDSCGKDEHWTLEEKIIQGERFLVWSQGQSQRWPAGRF